MSSAVAKIYESLDSSYLGIISERYHNSKYNAETDEANRLTIHELQKSLKNPNVQIIWELRDLVKCFPSAKSLSLKEKWELIRQKVLKLVRAGKKIPGNSLISFRIVYQNMEYYYNIPVNRIPINLLIQSISVAQMVQPDFDHKRVVIVQEVEYFPKKNSKAKRSGKCHERENIDYRLRRLLAC